MFCPIALLITVDNLTVQEQNEIMFLFSKPVLSA